MQPQFQFSIRSYTLTMQSHSHDYCQLVLPLSGCIDINIAGEQACIGPKQCAVIYAGEVHAFSAQEQAKFLVVDALVLPENFQHLSSHYLGISDSLLAFVWYLEKQLAVLVSASMAQHLSNLFCTLLAEYKFAPKLDNRIRQVVDYIEANYAKALPLTQLADVACLSVSQFKSLFKRQTGLSAGHYVTALRLEKAKVLLTHTDAPVAIVAEQVGYSDLSAFSRAFNRHFGQSPRTYIRTR